MYFKKILSAILLISIILFLPSCIKYYKLSTTEFPQGKDFPDEREIIANNLKTQKIYDQFSTKAIFDFIYQSDDIRKIYVDKNCLKKGKAEEEKQALLQKELEENKYWISFYILADVRDKSHIALTDKNSLWSFYLKTEKNEKIMPISMKEVDLEPEYQAMFGHKFNIFKRSYQFKFPLSNNTNNNIFSLVISSAYKEIEIIWNNKNKIKRESEKILKNEDFYWS